ncbi:54S ribosomal protein c83.06c, mitochondrial [Sipha flava]|jgi:large subunit ribosomal protein L36|uniref:Ribosomal protein n=1 Tax=Sipha flava TaxID=143950 RepID=A0A2S2RAV2_9HEMI|nr:54S ribosomal protein c83.06c, mitochondrial [Sipha flava]
MNFISNLFQKAIRPKNIKNASQVLSIIHSPTVSGSSLVLSRGFKVFGLVRKRCKDCYIVARDQRLYNLCKTHQKHKQMSIRHPDKAYYILTGVQQKKKREW